jgi:uncharacterized membrane protein
MALFVAGTLGLLILCVTLAVVGMVFAWLSWGSSSEDSSDEELETFFMTFLAG